VTLCPDVPSGNERSGSFAGPLAGIAPLIVGLCWWLLVGGAPAHGDSTGGTVCVLPFSHYGERYTGPNMSTASRYTSMNRPAHIVIGTDTVTVTREKGGCLYIEDRSTRYVVSVVQDNKRKVSFPLSFKNGSGDTLFLLYTRGYGTWSIARERPPAWSSNH